MARQERGLIQRFIAFLVAPAHRRQLLFAIASTFVISVEAYVVFVDQGGGLAIEGQQPYEIGEFAAGAPVSHSFLMRGDGLHAVQIRLHSDMRAAVRIQWILWSGSPEIGNMPRAFEGTEVFNLRSGRQWKSLNFVRNGTSNNRWYTLDVRVLDVEAAGHPERRPIVSLVASRDNPDRGGVLWLNGVRQPGSLFLRADRHGRTRYRRFLTEAAPNLPAVFQIELVQWLIFAGLHAAFLVFAWAIVTEAERTTASEPPS